MLYCIHNPISPDICSWSMDPWKSVKNRLKNSLFTLEVKKSMECRKCSFFLEFACIYSCKFSFFNFHSISLRFKLLLFYRLKHFNLNFISFHFKKVWLTHTLPISATFKNVNPRKSIKVDVRIHLLPLNIKISIYHLESSSFLSWCMLLNKLDIIP